MDAAVADPPPDVGKSLGLWRCVAGSEGPQSLLRGEAPFVFSFRSSDGERTDTAMVVCISRNNDRPPNVYENDIPNDYIDNFLITSFDNHYILVENQRGCTGIHVVDPLSSSWTPLATFPSRTPSLLSPLYRIWKVVTPGWTTAPGSIAVAIAGFNHGLVYTKLGTYDRWIVQDKMKQLGEFTDLVWSRGDGLFHALSFRADKVLSLVFDHHDDPDGKAEDLRYSATFSSLVAKYVPDFENYLARSCFQSARLVDSPSGLFVVRWRMLLYREGTKEREVDVYKMEVDGAERRWEPVKSLGKYSFFVGSRQCLALSSEDFSGLPGNLIYFPYDASFHMGGFYSEDFEDEVEYNLIYDLEKDEWGQRCGTEDDESGDDSAWPAVWITPRPRKHALKRKREEHLETETNATSEEMQCEEGSTLSSIEK